MRETGGFLSGDLCDYLCVSAGFDPEVPPSSIPPSSMEWVGLGGSN